VEQHKSGTGSAFTAKYNVNTLVYAEYFSDIREAIDREKQMKGWNRAWKIALIERGNPDWLELDPSSL
jgi:putative endonuclease